MFNKSFPALIMMFLSLTIVSGTVSAESTTVQNSPVIKSIKVGEHTIFYKVRDNTSKANKADRTIFLIPGAGSTSTSTDSLALELSKLLPKAQIVQFDLPAHGLSQGPFVPSIYDMATILNEAIQQGRESGEFANRFVAAGISMGGSIAQTLAVRNVSGLEKVVLISTSPEWSHLKIMADWDADFFSKNYPPMIEGDFAYGTTEEEQKAFHLWFPEATSSVEASLSDVKALIGFNIVSELNKITKKTLIIAGTADGVAPYVNAQILESRIKKSTLITVDNSHTYSMKKPDVVARDIYNFIK